MHNVQMINIAVSKLLIYRMTRYIITVWIRRLSIFYNIIDPKPIGSVSVTASNYYVIII